MSRSSRWVAPLTFAVLLAVAGSLMLPARVGYAAPPAKQIVYLDSAGQILVDSFLNNIRQPVWGSGLDNGWNYLTTGNFNGDGKGEIIATKGRTIKSFNPAPTANPLNLSYQLVDNQYGNDYQWHLLVAGDFQGLGRDQLLASYTYFCYSCGTYSENIVLFDFIGPPPWTPRLIDTDDYPLTSMASGDVNRDGKDDVVITIGGGRLILAVFAGPNLSNNPPLYVDDRFCGPWLDGKAGHMDPNRSGDQIVLSREGGECPWTIDLEYWNSDEGTLKNWGPLDQYGFAPSFTKLALGDANGDQVDEVFALRSPSSAWNPYLELLSPSDDVALPADQDIACGDYANWQQVAAGDVNGDGVAEAVVIASGMYRVYKNVAYPQVNCANQVRNINYVDVTPPQNVGTFRTSALAVDTIFTEFSVDVSPRPVGFMYDISTPGNSTPMNVDVQVIVPGTASVWTVTVPNTVWIKSPASGAHGSGPGEFTITVDPTVANAQSQSAVLYVDTTFPAAHIPVDVTLLRVNHINKTYLPVVTK